jgi:hypothetical protein
MVVPEIRFATQEALDMAILIRRVDAWSLFKPIGAPGITLRTSIYTDDLVMFLPPEVQDLHLTRGIFQVFEGASGLACNLLKCQMAPIRCTEAHHQTAHDIFPCQLVEFPVRYLDLPLSIKQLPRSSLQPLLDRLGDKLPTWKGKLMNRPGWLTLIKTTLSAGPIYTAICVKLLLWFHKAMTKIMRTFLWCGSDSIKNGKCLVTWSKVQQPLHLGGLGILDTRKMNFALRLRWV